MRLQRTSMSLMIAIIVVILGSQSINAVPQGESGVRLRAGAVVDTGLRPGLHLRLPVIEHIAILSNHWIMLDSVPMKLMSSDGQTLEVAYAALWRITDASAFCRATGCNEAQGRREINIALAPLMRRLFSARTANDLKSDRSKLLNNLPAVANEQLHRQGMKVGMVRLTSLTLPQNQLDTVYQVMRAALSQQAAQIRAQGIVAADRIRSQADAQQSSILGQAQIQAQATRGEAQAEATAIYARAYRQDPEFFRFYRSMAAYRQAIKHGDSVIVLQAGSGFLKYFNGQRPPGPRVR